MRRIHRWLGGAALVFVLLLTATGIALNHASAWKLDARRVQAPWLLNWYGIDAPPPTASHVAGEHRVTLLGGRLYVGGRELAADVSGLAGAVPADPFVVIALEDAALIATRDGRLVERIHLGASLPGPIEAVGSAGDRVVFRSRDELHAADRELLEIEPWKKARGQSIHWSTASPVPSEVLETIRSHYRGEGITVERLLADLHSGRLLGGAGPLVIDAAGIAFAVLGVTGLVIWIRGRRPRP